MQTYSSLFQHEALKIINARIEILRSSLEGRHDLSTTDYMRGQLASLREMLSILDEAAEAAEQHNR